MIEFNQLLNTCLLTTESSRSIAYYSHLIPIFFSLSLALLVYFKAPKNIMSKIFLAFSFSFSFWLMADLITWVSNSYYLVYAFWAPVDYIETVMFISGLYFVMVFVKGSDISRFKKLILFIATLIPFIITITKNSVLGFGHSVCEAVNNGFLLEYRFIIEVLVVLIILFYILIPLFNKSIQIRKNKLLVLASVFLFLTIFGVTSYLSANSGYYELNLYALLITPLFLLFITYSIFTLDIFNFKVIKTQYLVVGLVILIVGQLFFVNGATDQLLTTLTVIVTVLLSILLFKNLQKESEQRLQIENLSRQLENYNDKLKVANDKLKDLDKLKTEFLSLASHQLRTPLTAIKGYISMVLDGDYGKINKGAKEVIERVYISSQNLTKVVEDLLDVSKIEQGGMKYEMIDFNLAQLAEEMTHDLSINAEKAGLVLSFNSPDKDKCIVKGDQVKIRQVVLNLIDNSIKYTKKGSVSVSVFRKDDKVLMSVKDTGMGMTEEIKASLFQKFSRGDGARMNTSGSGLGLYLSKEIIEAHKGRIWIDSDGSGKGSIFNFELQAVK
jgi:signal transduction histidine kinase